MAYPKNSWSILPATDALFDRQKATLQEVMLAMGGGEILIVYRTNGDGKDTHFFLSTAGTMGLPNGTVSKAHHDQNLRPYGYVTVRASIPYTVVDGKVVCEIPDLQFGATKLTLATKAPLFVFK